MNKEIFEHLRDMASIQAEIVRRMGAAYGSVEDWKNAFTVSVHAMEFFNRIAHEESKKT